MNQDNPVPSQSTGEVAMPLPPSPNVAQVTPISGAAPAVPPQLAATPASVPWLEPTVPVQPAAQAANTPGSSPSSDPQLYVVAPAVADDGDLIEKEWVLKAKQIVERTRMDPHQQVKEMHAFKADYMKKRYNKVIEPVEE